MWTAERVEEVKGHVLSGLSRGAIAQIYGVTRNAVVGLCYRHGISGPNNQIMGAMVANDRKRKERERKARFRIPTSEGETRITKMIREKRKAPVVVELSHCDSEPPPLAISLLDLTANHCRWVCDGTDDNCLPTYCGHQTVRGSYCAHHARRVYVS